MKFSEHFIYRCGREVFHIHTHIHTHTHTYHNGVKTEVTFFYFSKKKRRASRAWWRFLILKKAIKYAIFLSLFFALRIPIFLPRSYHSYQMVKFLPRYNGKTPKTGIFLPHSYHFSKMAKFLPKVRIFLLLGTLHAKIHIFGEQICLGFIFSSSGASYPIVYQ